MLLRRHVQAEPRWAREWRAAKQPFQFTVRILIAACSVELMGVEISNQRQVLDFAEVCAAQRGATMQEAWLRWCPIGVEPHEHRVHG